MSNNKPIKTKSTPVKTGSYKAARDARGRFLPGESGNPAGTISKFRKRIRHLVAPNLDYVFDKTMEAIEKCEPWAVRLFWEEILPHAFGRAVTPIALSSEDALVNVSQVILDVVPPEQRERIAQELEKVLEVSHAGR